MHLCFAYSPLTNGLLLTMVSASYLLVQPLAGTFNEVGNMFGSLLIGLVSQALGLNIGYVAYGVQGLLSIGLINRPQAILYR